MSCILANLFVQAMGSMAWSLPGSADHTFHIHRHPHSGKGQYAYKLKAVLHSDCYIQEHEIYKLSNSI